MYIAQLKEKNKEKITIVPVKTTTTQENPSLHLLGLGDSVMKGYGADKGDDILSQVGNQLEKRKRENVTTENLGISGLTSKGLKENLEKPDVQESIRKSNIIFIHIGGNDLLRIAKKKGVVEAIHEYETVQSQTKENLEAIVQKVVQLNPDARILLFDLYNPLKSDSEYYSLSKHLFDQWNMMYYEIGEGYSNVRVIDSYKALSLDKDNLFSPDGVHPNDEGYKKISEAVMSYFTPSTEI
jgi:lysophospholipase L1-like esterase